MMSSGSTVFFFDFDIFSIGADLDGVAGRDVEGRAARRRRCLDPHLGGRHPAAVGVLIGLVHHHALREEAREGLVAGRHGRSAFMARVKKRE